MIGYFWDPFPTWKSVRKALGLPDDKLEFDVSTCVRIILYYTVECIIL